MTDAGGRVLEAGDAVYECWDNRLIASYFVRECTEGDESAADGFFHRDRAAAALGYLLFDEMYPGKMSSNLYPTPEAAIAARGVPGRPIRGRKEITDATQHPRAPAT